MNIQVQILALIIHFFFRSIIGKEWGSLRENLKKMPRKRREEEGIHGKQAKSLDCCFANFWSDLPTGCCFYLPKYQAQICHWRIIENLFRSWIEPLSYAHGPKKTWFLLSGCEHFFFHLVTHYLQSSRDCNKQTYENEINLLYLLVQKHFFL